MTVLRIEGPPYVCFAAPLPPLEKNVHMWNSSLPKWLPACFLSLHKHRPINTTPCSRGMPHFRCSRNANIMVLDFPARTSPSQPKNDNSFSRLRCQQLTGRACPAPFARRSATFAPWAHTFWLHSKIDRTCHNSAACSLQARQVCMEKRKPPSACAPAPLRCPVAFPPPPWCIQRIWNEQHSGTVVNANTSQSKGCGFDSRRFTVRFERSPCDCVCFLQLPPTVLRYPHKLNWTLKIFHRSVCECKKCIVVVCQYVGLWRTGNLSRVSPCCQPITARIDSSQILH